MTHAMLKGSNVQWETASLRAVLCWSPGSGAPDIDASALLLGSDGRVRTDEDFVFYNQPQHPDGSVRHVAKEQETDGIRDSVEVSLNALTSDVERVMLSASSDGGTFADVAGLQLLLYGTDEGEPAEPVVTFDIEPETGSETAIICGELYRRGDGWKFRALGQGYETGLLGLATEFGVSVAADDSPETEHREVPDEAAPVPDPAPISDEDLDATVAVVTPAAPPVEPESDFPLPAPRPQAVPDLPPGPPSVPPQDPYRPGTQAGAAAFMVPGSHDEGGAAAFPGPPAHPPQQGWTGQTGYDAHGPTQEIQHGYPQRPQQPPSTQPAYGYPQPTYGYPQPDPNFTLPPQGPQFLPR